jgi:CRISPR-associated endoribonuclease Cas6
VRFSVELSLEEEKFPKDKNRIFISLLKNNFSGYNQEYFESQYKNMPNKMKNFTFSVYMGKCKFLRDEIVVPDKKIYLNFSTNNYEDGIMFYNSFLTNMGKEYPLKNNKMKIEKIRMIKEKVIYDNKVIFKTLSPIVVREHGGDNKKTWYHSLSNEKGQVIFKENMRQQLGDEFGEKAMYDFEDIEIDISKDNRDVKVKNYGIEVLSNVTKIQMKAKPYILDYFYKVGVGSKRSSGFGMLDIV